MTRSRPLWAWLFLPQLALVVIATILATTGRFPTTLFRSPVDKLGHLAAYGGLSFFAVAFFGRGRSWPVIIGLLLVATLEELSQRASATRTFDLGDLAMNLIGILVFGVVSARIAGQRARERIRCTRDART
jgi:VanZ family protein